MGVDPLALIRAQQAEESRVRAMTPGKQAPGLVMPGPNGEPQVYHIPQGPGSPGYRDRIPPGEPDGTQAATPSEDEQILDVYVSAMQAPSASNGHVAAPARRIVVSFGRGEGEYVVGIEEAPYWNVEKSYRITGKALAEVLELLRQLAPIKDLTGGDVAFLEEDYLAQNTRSRKSPAASAGIRSHRTGSGKAAPPARAVRPSPAAGAVDGAAGPGDDPAG